MIRFIDLRGQGTGYKFAFWDTVVDEFIALGPDEAWDDIYDLTEAGRMANYDVIRMVRMVNLCPAWTKNKK